MNFEIIEGEVTDSENFALDKSDLATLSRVFRDYLFVNDVLPSGVIAVQLVLSISSEKEMTKINKRFRHISRPTDVLSFPLWENSSWKNAPELWSELPLGDIFICPLQVRKCAEENLTSERQETVLDLCHGFLHLIGHDHLEESEKQIMWQEQDKLLARFFSNNE
ncbi:MAG: rRNA maturation RNase YbeY [Synergistaceae bacterium]|nr:rRNA maturation RNase YbeY [Synergistaceae bacterium]